MYIYVYIYIYLHIYIQYISSQTTHSYQWHPCGHMQGVRIYIRYFALKYRRHSDTLQDPWRSDTTHPHAQGHGAEARLFRETLVREPNLEPGPSSRAGLCRVSECVLYARYHTGWRRLIGCPKLQIILHKRATKYRSLLRKMTYIDKGSHESSPPCMYIRTPYIHLSAVPRARRFA